MNIRIEGTEASHRERWLSLLDNYGVGHPKSLHLMEVPGGLVQATIGEPPGQLCLESAPGNVLMFNLSPVQALRQVRDGRSFVSHMLHGDMTLMPWGVPSQWSWNSTCDRLDVIVSPDVFGDGNKLAVLEKPRCSQRWRVKLAAAKAVSQWRLNALWTAQVSKADCCAKQTEQDGRNQVLAFTVCDIPLTRRSQMLVLAWSCDKN